MATLKEVKTKIGAVKKTKQITKAMNMVAASRLRGAQNNMEGFRPYAEKFAEILGGLSGRAGDETSPLLLPHEEVIKKHIILCTSDRGLCGGFNAHLISKAGSFIKEAGDDEDIEFSVTNFGKKGRDWGRKEQIPIISEHIGVIGTVIKFNIASTVGKGLIDGFLNGEYDEVYVVYSEFIGMGRQVATIKQLLPIPPLETDEDEIEDQDKPYLAEHICEPSPDELLGELLPMSVYAQLYRALLETSTSEHAARMMAMDNASKACDDMIENLTLAYNKARQATITAELMDIVGGAEALKG
ncbi:MAG: ATP synthase F1 subunit gamma [Deltaproteobacteria bacterium]|nr:ATP synthase F1 subunit gamma [Deltaproteobacteria bacterium]MBW2597195.1 ATP synthase F1 subunit gamma [Deltaproteobacteria bacterium]MBW2640418.1 ATP synthase F1 subunit gamma [Deltaproteobacteria bacterium]MBW2679811.1 ATP synthase F1 subunit gamma [Deltaproteobacteria bacterium]